MANVGESSRCAHVADDPEHHLLRSLLCDREEEHCELSGFDLSWEFQDVDGRCCAYVCVTVAEARVKVDGMDYSITFNDAHISVANIFLVPDKSKKHLDSQEKVTSLFRKKLDRARVYLGSPMKGRLGWNGMSSPKVCCLDLRLDTIGVTMTNVVSQFDIFNAPGQMHRSLEYLDGPNLHLSIRREFQIRNVPGLLHRASSSDAEATAPSI